MPDSAAPDRLDRFLARELQNISRSRLKALIQDSGVTLKRAGREKTLYNPSETIKPGDELVLHLPKETGNTNAPAGENIPLSILYEDEHLIAIDKPAGLVVHPAPGHAGGTLVNALLHHDPAIAGVGDKNRPGIVHRLDKDTSGVMVAARTGAAYKGLVRQFSDHSIERRYSAIVKGLPSPPAGEINAPIGRDPRNRKRMAVTEAGKPAITRYRSIRGFLHRGRPVFALLECHLLTGRTHQVRVHLAHINAPVLGDPLYGRAFRAPKGLPADVTKTVQNLKRQALHATLLSLNHPISGKDLTFESELSGELRCFLETLEAGLVAADAETAQNI